MIDTARLKAWLRRYAELIHVHKDELTALDATIGDADHGTNMDRGMQAVLHILGDEEDANENIRPAELLKQVAMVLISKVGGASGPLYGTAFLRMAQAVGEKEQLNEEDIAQMFAAGLNGMKERGKADLGDKTMVDAYARAVSALSSSLAEGFPLKESLAQAISAAKEGSDQTIPLIARKGRASYLGERSRGHRDPGSLSTVYLFEAALVFAGEGEINHA
ncbi:MAG: Phosphoenolpyruvate-dihydroxyacetone phosphotransferase [Candidatus Carbobacillus altaicus]|uniref:phosphoenolpyruvate--glycerone phosphotransferase n=1 Tax=Candidatus Carbonibacillus altaicus TaxID=2163959 RepID=A0A2R6Y3R7_9BACL|nr:MAG: Phosphoenolpyruvate-dihydroxyacetone phosphotransferase [Candidatus Carbobacillus altaicus]